MPSTRSRKKASTIDSLMEKGSEALAACKYFEAERTCQKAFQKAFHAGDYERMARILLPLQESRRQIREQALDARRVYIVNDGVPSKKDLQSGCYLVQPPRVGVDGRSLHELGRDAQVPLLVVVREPRTQTGLWPIVSIGAVTIRTKVPPPSENTGSKEIGDDPLKTSNHEKWEVIYPPVEWFIETIEALGDEAIDEVPPEESAADRVEALYERLETIPDHEKLHQALEQACQQAAKETAN